VPLQCGREAFPGDVRELKGDDDAERRIRHF
jgi:hypothetical protein